MAGWLQSAQFCWLRLLRHLTTWRGGRRARLRPFYELRKIPLIKEHSRRILLICYPKHRF